MDMGNGQLGQISEAKFRELNEKKVKGLFQTGECIEIRGSRFQIENIGTHFMTLKILKQQS